MSDRAFHASRNSVGDIGSSESDGASILARVGDRNLVFSEARQAIHELSDSAAYVWRSLDAGLSAVEIVGELIATGVDPDQAESAVMIIVEEFRTLRTPAPSPAPSPPPSPSSARPEQLTRLTRRTIMIADVAVQLHLSGALVADVEAVLGPLIKDVPDTDMQLSARLVGDTVNFFSPGQPDWSCERSQFIPLLKAQLIECVLLCARYEVALHAAALIRENDAVLLMGGPGAGKTTLAIALAKAGFEVLADDVVLLDEKGLVTGVSLPFTAKSSSWPLLSQYWPGIVTTPSHSRPDGQTLCYIPQDPIADPRPRRISVVVLLNRQDHARICIEELDLVCALSTLVADGATRDERLSKSGFTALVDGLRGARCYRLTYSDLMEAADAVRGLGV